MEKLILLIVIMCQIIFVNLFALEYEWTNNGKSLPKSKGVVNLSAIDIIGDSIWICSGLASSISGLKGEIYFSSDGGNTFSIQNTLYGTHSIKMINSKLGFCAGYEGQVYKTTNGGQEWVRIGSAGSTMTSIDFPTGSDTGYVGGFSGILKKVTQNGIIGIKSETSNNIRSISCPSKDHNYILWWADCVFYDGNKPAILQEISVDSKKPLSFLSIFMLNDTLGWISGAYGLIAKTITGGWNLDEKSAYTEQPTPIQTDIYSIKFFNENIGVSCGYGGNVLVTDNGGKLWNLAANGFTNDLLLATEFNKNGDIYIVGNSKENETPTLLKGKLISTSIIESNVNYLSISPNPASDYILVCHTGLDPVSNSPFFKGGSEGSLVSPTGGSRRWTELVEVGWTDSPSIKRWQGGVSYYIYNIFGEVQELPRPSDTPSKEGEFLRIDISNLSAGVYFIKIGNKFEKFVKM